LQELQRYIETKLNLRVRTTALGFIQRGGSPSAFDRVLASKLGVAAVDLLVNGQGGQAVGLKNNKIIYKDLAAVNEEIVDKPDLYRLLDMLLY